MPDGGGGTQTQSSGPPGYVKPYIIGQTPKGGKPGITGVLPEAQRLYEAAGPTYFPGETVAGLTPTQQQAMDLTTQRATQGANPLNATASNYLQGAIGGNYVNQFLGSPADSALFQSIQSRVSPAVNSAASLAGRTGSGAHEGVLARELTNAYAPIAAQMYGQERGLQQQAAGMAPGLAGAMQAQDYTDLGMLQNVGALQQRQNQLGINADVARYDFEQNIPQQKLNQYLAAVYGSPGSTTTTQVPGQPMWQSILGGGLGLGGLGIQAAGLF